MNDRIKQLASQCWDERMDGKHFDQEMFAQLIVKECCSIADGWVNNLDDGKNYPSERIIEHFGFEK